MNRYIIKAMYNTLTATHRQTKVHRYGEMNRSQRTTYLVSHEAQLILHQQTIVVIATL
jgi:hypothetical protein